LCACDGGDGKNGGSGDGAGSTDGDGAGTTGDGDGASIPIPDYSALSSACFSACEANLAAQCSCCVDYYGSAADSLCDTYCDVEPDDLSVWCFACEESWMEGTYESYVTYGYSGDCLDAYFESFVESMECSTAAYAASDCSDPMVGNSEAIDASRDCQADATAQYESQCD
jgi:hypothetical protein